MDIAVRWGVLRRLRTEIDANPVILLSAIILDAAVLGAFVIMKARSDAMIVWVSLAAVALIFAGEWRFIRRHGPDAQGSQDAR